MAVPKKIQKMGNIFFGLLAALNDAMDRKDLVAVETVLSRNIFDGTTPVTLRAFAEYLLAEDAVLAAQPAESILAGTVVFGVAA